MYHICFGVFIVTYLSEISSFEEQKEDKLDLPNLIWK